MDGYLVPLVHALTQPFMCYGLVAAGAVKRYRDGRLACIDRGSAEYHAAAGN